MVSYEKDILTNIWGTAGLKCRSWFKSLEPSPSSALKTEKKLNATSLKILICTAQIFTTSQDICA